METSENNLDPTWCYYSDMPSPLSYLEPKISTMNHLFVPNKQSLELKELGFNEPCAARWKNDDCIIIEEINNISFTLAPTWDQAFQWFREEHGLFGYVSHGVINSKLLFFPVVHDKDDLLWEDIDCDIESHKEAQLIVLKKMIEIVKNNKSV